MPYFTPEFNTFFKGLAAHNYKEWMDENRKIYHKEVKEPFKRLVEDLITEISQYQKLEVEPKEVIFRINNDIRFSKDKTPYKLHVGANIAQGGRKAFNEPAFYVHLSPGESFIASGIYKPDKDTLYTIRKGVGENLKEFGKLRNQKEFKAHFGDFSESEKNKVIAKELKPYAEKEPMLYNKQWFFTKDFESGEELVLREDLLEEIMKYYHAAQPMNSFLRKIT